MKTYSDIVGDGGSNMAGQVEAHEQKLAERLKNVRHIIAVMSGKGGVGKSSVALNVASALAQENRSVGIVDADINGASIARMAGVRGMQLVVEPQGIRPAIAGLNLRIMSIDLFMPRDNAPVVWDAPTQKDAYTWRGMMEANAIREFFSDTLWGELDFLLIDLPPGTDKLPNIVDLLPKISGTIIVTLPSGLSQFVVEKSIRMAQDTLKTPVLGLVENMSTYICARCGEVSSLFNNQHSESLCEKYQMPLLGKIPFDPALAAAADAGELFMSRHGASAAGKTIATIARTISDKFGMN